MLESLVQVNPTTIDLKDAAVLIDRTKNFVLPIPNFPKVTAEVELYAGFSRFDVKFNGTEALVFENITSVQATKISEYLSKEFPDFSTISASTFQRIPIAITQILGEKNIFHVSQMDLKTVAGSMRFTDGSNDSPDTTKPESFLGLMEVSDGIEYRAVRITKGFSFKRENFESWGGLPNGGVVIVGENKSKSLTYEECQKNWTIKNWTGNEERIVTCDVIPEHNVKSISERLASIDELKLGTGEEVLQAITLEKVLSIFKPEIYRYQHRDPSEVDFEEKTYLNPDNIKVAVGENGKVTLSVHFPDGGENSRREAVWFPLVLRSEVLNNGVREEDVAVETKVYRDYSWDCIESKITIEFENLHAAIATIEKADFSDLATRGRKLEQASKKALAREKDRMSLNQRKELLIKEAAAILKEEAAAQDDTGNPLNNLENLAQDLGRKIANLSNN